MARSLRCSAAWQLAFVMLGMLPLLALVIILMTHVAKGLGSFVEVGVELVRNRALRYCRLVVGGASMYLP